jgi:hypothetical protein
MIHSIFLNRICQLISRYIKSLIQKRIFELLSSNKKYKGVKYILDNLWWLSIMVTGIYNIYITL